MRKVLPSSLTAQMVMTIMLALLTAQLITAWVLYDAHKANLYNSEQWKLIRRTGYLVQELNHTPRIFHNSMLRAASVPTAVYTITHTPLLTSNSRSAVERVLIQRLNHSLGKDYSGAIRIHLEEYSSTNFWSDNCVSDSDDPETQNDACIDKNRHFLNHHKASFIVISLALPGGNWLNLLAEAPSIKPLAATQTLLFLLISFILVLLAIAVMVRRITRPMRALSLASNRLGRGEHVEPIPETGPDDLIRATRAFNQMNERINRFIADRTSMLAALSHDLRTPITTLRLRIELLPDTPDKERLLATLDEMQQMAEATLSFARESAIREESRKVNMDALVDSLCEDLNDIGMNVTYIEGPDIIASCRPVNMRRALRNLIENAVKYGHRARVSIAAEKHQVNLTIDDDGPGIHPEQMKEVFEPFVRLEHSRNRDTGGIGLGMAIARNIIHSHGGQIKLSNRPEGGLRVFLSIPL